MELKTAGRTDFDEYFKLSGIREDKKRKHTPFLVFIESTLDIKIEIVDNAKKLVENYPGVTKVMAQWSGQWSSDFMQFTVDDLKKYILKNPKKDYQII